MTRDDGGTEAAGPASDTDSRVYAHVRETILTGVAITVPAVVTIYVLSVVLDFVVEALGPVIAVLRWLGVISRFENVEFIALLIDLGVYSFVVDFFTELVAIVVLLGIIAVVGTVGRHQHGEKIIDLFDLAISSIPRTSWGFCMVGIKRSIIAISAIPTKKASVARCNAAGSPTDSAGESCALPKISTMET